MVHLDEAANMSVEQFREELKRLSDEVVNFKPSQKTRQTRTYVTSHQANVVQLNNKQKWLKCRQ